MLLTIFETALARFGLVFVGFYIYSWISLLLHESGHLLAAWLTGMDVHEVRLGSGKRVRSFHFIGADWSVRPVPMGGAVMFLPTTLHGYRFKMIVTTLGGVAATMALAGLMVWLAIHVPWKRTGIEFSIRILLYGACVFELVRLARTLWPQTHEKEGETFHTDGLHLWRLLFPKPGDAQKAEGLVLHSKAIRAMQAGDLKQAAQYMRETIALIGFPDAAPIQRALAGVLADIGQLQDAEELYRELIGKVDQNTAFYRDGVDAFSSFALWHNRRDLFGECEGYLRTALECHPSAHTLKGTLGSILVEQGKGGEGRRLLEDLYDRRTNDVDMGISAAYLSRLAQIRGDAEAAARLRAEALRILPSDSIVKRLLA